MKRLFSKRRVALLLGLFVVLLVAGELVARFGLGLGDPPLTVEHPEIEYLFAPDQDRRRFGNRFVTNAYGMRSADFPENKSDPQEMRVLVLGDSVINGGNLTDQSELATELLQAELAEQHDRPVIVGNISAGTWGPANLLAYLQSFGTFDADVIIIVLSSHDLTDLPTFGPLNETTHPTRPPLTALTEGITRYLPRYLLSIGEEDKPTNRLGKFDEAHLDEGEASLRKLLQACLNQTDAVAIVQHADKHEAAAGQLEPRGERIAAIARDMGVPMVSDMQAFSDADSSTSMYRDWIHPTIAGQRKLAAVLEEAVKLAESNATDPTP